MFWDKGGKHFHESMRLTAVTVFSRTASPTHPARTLLDTHLLLFPESPDGQLQIESPPPPHNPNFVVAEIGAAGG